MKCGFVAAVGLVLARTAGAAQLQLAKSTTPMAQVVQLLSEMKARIEGDGMLEQQSYDKYACWCEETLARKARDISTAKEQIADLGTKIVKLKGEIASHGAEIQQLEKDIQQNLDSQGEAKAVRDNDFEDYNGEKTESEQCIGALEAAVKALAGAGAGRFLETTVKQAELLSVVAGVRSVMGHTGASRGISSEDLALIHRFVDHPADFASRRPVGQLAQLSSSPFGDYAPQSTQIQGILKGMYDTFAGDLEKANAKEADAQKAFEELMATKLHELETLKATLQQQQMDHAQKTESLADSQELLDTTKAQLAADEEFFEVTKGACQVKSQEWNERSRLRTMELAGVNKAIEILDSPEARATFESATTTFVQLSSIKSVKLIGSSATAARSKAFKRLAGVARKFHNLGVAQIAAKIKAGGHFDKVLESIDKMVELLRAEEQSDIQHRDRCQNSEGKNKNDMEDLNAAIDKASTSIEQLAREEDRLNGEIQVLEGDIAKTQADMAELLEFRNADVKKFQQAVKDDTAAIGLIEQAMVMLRRFFDESKIELSLLSKKEPVYTVDADKAPETNWSGGKHTGSKEESGGIVAIMEMLIEDLQDEIKTARVDDAEAQQLFEQQRGKMQDSLDASLATKLATESELSEVRSWKAGTEEHKDQQSGDLSAEEDLKSALFSDCSWVATHFESRREQRKTEIDGLVEAKGYLAGVTAGDF